MEEELTVKILDKLNVYWDDNISVGTKYSISYGELILAILKSRSLRKTSELLNISNRTLERYVPKIFFSLLSKVIDTDNTVPWKFSLLKLIDVRQCYACKCYRSTSDYYNANYLNECKFCNLTKRAQPELRSKRLTRNKEYYKANHGKELARLKESKLRRSYRVPKWADLNLIEEFYKKCPEGYQVDHIIPLQGKIVSGLHVVNNLQYLTEYENKSKNNRYDGGEV